MSPSNSQQVKPLNIHPVFVAFAAIFGLSILGQSAFGQQAEPKISMEKSDKKVTINIDGDLFTEYDFGNYKKPIFYPLNIAKGIGMTRNYPMKKTVGEQPDHPHHKSVWFSHEINGIMFWSEKGIVKHVKFSKFETDTGTPSFTAVSQWIHGDKIHLTDETTVQFLAGSGWRAMDFEVKLIASEDDVLINDTKEGTFAVRVHPNLRNKEHRQSGVVGGGSMHNSEGGSGAGIWGKPAAWVAYDGKINDKKVGLAIFDHPKNLRHPTTWHARDYGLLAANPFGLHYFQHKEKGAGEVRLKKGETLTLRYRLVIYEGDCESAKVGKMYEKYGGAIEQNGGKSGKN